MRFLRTRLARVLAGVVIAALAGTWAAGAVQDKHEVARMTEKMKSVCVGRFLVDLPEEAEYELTRPRIAGLNIAAHEETDDAFQTRVNQRKAQIEATPDRSGGRKNLEMIREVKNDYGVTGKIFVHGRTVTEGQSSDGLTVERYRYEGVAVEALVHGNGVSVDFSTDFYNPDSISLLFKLISQLVPNPSNAIPTEPGFCIDRAYIRDPLNADQGEEVMMAAWLPSRPDVAFKLMLAAGTEPDQQGLLERSADSNTRFAADLGGRVSTIRADQRTIGGLVGEELVERFVEDNNAVVYSFWWEVNGTEDDVFVPHIAFTMDTGISKHGPVSSSLSEGAAIGLWDKVAASFRRRPSETKKSVTEASLTPIGTSAFAGDSCPESGWWECADSRGGTEVLGGARQYIRHGDRMPQALLLSAPTVWERFRGLQPSFETSERTAWRLIDKRSRQRVPPAVPLARTTPVGSASVTIGSGSRDIPHQHVAPGSFAGTGLPCPASGWWRCEDSHALDGTRWFALGSLLPPATFAVAPGIFGRAANAPKAIQRRSAWRLMRLADTPYDASEHTTGEGILPHNGAPPVEHS